MPKMKTNRGAVKRFKKTASGGYKFRRSNRAHILTKKAPKRKAHLRANQMVNSSDVPMVRRMLREQ